jgi:hypothetical protein
VNTDDNLRALMRNAAGAATLVVGPEEARSRADRRARQRVLTSAAVASVVAVSAVGALLLNDGQNDTLRISPAGRAPATAQPVPTTGSSPSSSPSSKATAPPSSVATVSPSPSARAKLWLNGDDLGVTQVGAPYKEAVAAISAALGPPQHNPDPVTHCVEAQFEVSWAQFHLAVSGGKVNGWASKDPRLKTPSGVRVGTTIATLKRVYGSRLRLSPPQIHSPWLFGVEGVKQFGYLTGGTDAATVNTFVNGACTGP